MSKNYDIIIIGAGIGGLVCGNYLSKAGKKVLILEKHTKAGGYCTSYSRGRFQFDAGPHSLGSCRVKGQLGRLFRELGLNKDVYLNRVDPSDIVMVSKYKLHFYNNIDRTLSEFQETFPKEKNNIKKFFELMNAPNIGFLHKKLSDITFQQLLDKYFATDDIKIIFGSVLGNLGLSIREASAFTAVILYREYIFDGGYYLEGGMQEFSSLLARSFSKTGGIIRYSSYATKILISNNKVSGVEVNNKEIVSSDLVISNSDACHTYFNLLDKKISGSRFLSKLKKLQTSRSLFTVHLGLSSPLSDYDSYKCTTLWYFPTLEIDNIYTEVASGKLKIPSSNRYIVFGFPNPTCKNISIDLYILAPFKNETYWRNNKDHVFSDVMSRAKAVFPDILSKTENVSIDTPAEYYRYTYNKDGAISGWASTPSQIGPDIVPMKSHVEGLYLVGHWTTSSGGQGGVPMVVHCGRQLSKMILGERSLDYLINL